MKRKKSVLLVLLLLFSMTQLFCAEIGDVNNSNAVDIVDALLISQHYVGLTPPNFDQSVADCNGDGSIDIVDSLLIARYYVGLINVWPPAGAPTPVPTTAVQTPVPTATPGNAGTLPALHTEGNWIKDANNNNVRLKGVAFADIDAIYKGDRSQSVYTTINDIIDRACSGGWNIDVFRLTVHPRVDDETGNHGWLNYTPDDFFNNILDPAVQYSIQKGKYVIVDWHYVGVSWNDGNVVSNTENFWNYIAPRYANNPNIIFELFNEPGQGTWSDWKSRAQGWVNIIRNNHGANNIIIVGGPNWSQVTPKSSGDLLSGSNLVYSCHIYPQHGIPNWIDWVANNAPVMMTEWGFEADGPQPVNGTTSWGNQYKSFINSKPNVGWIAWCFDFVYRSVMFDKNWVLLGNGQSTSSSRFHGGPADTYQNYMGQFAKDWLAE
ncbi:MAG: cellulase family glycosylhydrolase [Spirochaetales bacterium]|nr:cellulase family glycosylhydrolase [Spirochaetales bacterium]